MDTMKPNGVERVYCSVCGFVVGGACRNPRCGFGCAICGDAKNTGKHRNGTADHGWTRPADGEPIDVEEIIP